MTEQHAIERAQIYFLDEHYGCAETVLLVLQEACGLDNAGDSSPAMAFHGGVAWSGNMCGALTGATNETGGK